MKIVVTTPTGHVGSHLVDQLRWVGVRPTLLVRDATRLDHVVRETAEVIECDLTDADAVGAAVSGADRLFWVNPSLGGEDPVADHVRVGEVAATVIGGAAVPHTVFLSSVGAEKRGGVGDIDGLALTEQLLDAQVHDGVAVTHLRCGFFFTNLLLQLPQVESGRIPVAMPLDAPLAWVAPRDIATVAALRLLAPPPSGRVVQAVHGPCDLSWRRATEIVSEASGRQVVAEEIADEAMLELLAAAGLGPVAAQAVLGMSTGLRGGFVPEQPRNPSTTTPTTLRSWVREELVPALGAVG